MKKLAVLFSLFFASMLLNAQPTIIHAFAPGELNNPSGPLLPVGFGSPQVYGNALYGGLNGRGGVYEIDTTTLAYRNVWDATATAANPRGNLSSDSSSNLYGTTWGQLFKLTKSGSTFTGSILHTNTGNDIYGFKGGTWIDTLTNNVYFTGYYAGGASGCGGVARYTAAGVYTLLYSFVGGTDGCHPSGTVTGVYIAGTIKTLYLFGTTVYGGTSNAGTIYRIAIKSGVVTYTSLYSFTGPSSGCITGQTREPDAAPILVPAISNPTRIADYNLYGTATGGGNCGGTGGLFKFSLSGSTYNSVFTAASQTSVAGWVDTQPVFTPSIAGQLYPPNSILLGTNAYGGVFSHTQGVLFALEPTGSTYTFATIFDFGAVSGQPYGTWINTPTVFPLGIDGMAYWGTANLGGTTGCTAGYNLGCGTVYSF